MGIEAYNTTPGSNSTIYSINIAEGCPFANLNNAKRQGMADIRTYANTAEWFQYGNGTSSGAVTYASATSFTIAGADVRTAWHIGRRVKAVASTPGTIYGTITNSTFSTNTTVTVAWDSGSLSNEALTAYLGISSATNTSMPARALTDVSITGASAITTIDPNADYLPVYDGSASANKKVLTRYVAPVDICLVCSDEATPITAGTGKATFHLPFAFTVVSVFGELSTVQASGNIFTVDVNEAGTTILSTKLTIDNSEETSATAATPAVVSDAALAQYAKITVDVDQIGNGTAKGLKVWLRGYWT